MTPEPDVDEYDAEYSPSDTVLFRDVCGNERVIHVEEKRANIKDGRPGIHGEVVSADPPEAAPDPGSGVWAFDSQIVDVVDGEPAA